MANIQAKRSRKAVDNALTQKLQDLPLLCVEAICKVTPTSRLISLYSTAVPLPGASWNLGLQTALKRRKISISEDPSYGPNGDSTRIDALFDSSGAKVATIKHPEAFNLSPICEFVQSAAVPFRVLPSFAAAEPRLRCVISGQPLLPHLSNVRRLTLVDLGAFEKPYPPKTLDDKDFMVPILKEVLPQLESFAFHKSHENRQMLDIALVEMLPEMDVLKRLDVPPVTFGSLMRAANAGAEESEAVWRALASLSSIRLRQACRDGSPSLNVQLLNFMSGCCTQLTRLTVFIKGELKPYLVALQSLVSLTVLGLELHNVNTKGMTFGEDERIRSVSELRWVDRFAFLNPQEKGALASLFPNLKTAALHYEYKPFATELCEQAVWPQLEKLSCFSEYYQRPCFAEYYQRSQSLAQFLASPDLPSVVDLSPVTNDPDLARDSDSLTAIYGAVQSGPIKALLLRGPLHREALPRLQAYVDLSAGNAKITAWKDRDLGEQTTIIIRSYQNDDVVVPATEFSELTEVRIVGTKEKGGDFMIHVVHQHSKKTDILDLIAIFNSAASLG